MFVAFGTELTFELPDNDKQCFYEELEEDVKFDIDYQVSLKTEPLRCVQDAAIEFTYMNYMNCLIGSLIPELNKKTKTGNVFIPTFV